MKLRYYLRGLGVGIIVTAIIMSFTRQPEKLTDAQIKMRALELGMVEESVLADLQINEELMIDEETFLEELFSGEDDSNERESSETEVTEQTSDEQVSVTADEQEEKVINSDDLTSNASIDEIQEEEKIISDNVQNNEMVENYILITVERGNGSDIVSRKLYEAGLVESAIAYNQFLVKNGYDRNILVGNHEIPVDATDERMAKILCGME